jgi:hypothetical protein
MARQRISDWKNGLAMARNRRCKQALVAATGTPWVGIEANHSLFAWATSLLQKRQEFTIAHVYLLMLRMSPAGELSFGFTNHGW